MCCAGRRWWWVTCRLCRPTHVDVHFAVARSQVVQHRRLVQVRQVRHVLHLLELWRVHLLQVILLARSFLKTRQRVRAPLSRHIRLSSRLLSTYSASEDAESRISMEPKLSYPTLVQVGSVNLLLYWLYFDVI